MHDKFCHSCAAPMSGDFKGKSDEYCKYCTDDQGKLKSEKEIQQGIAGWFQSWQPGLDAEKAFERAKHYMKSMPKWAD